MNCAVKRIPPARVCVFPYITRRVLASYMLFRQRGIDALQWEEMHRLDARRAYERECRVLKRQLAVLEKDHRALRDEHDVQCQRIDAVVNRSGEWLMSVGQPATSHELAAAQSEKQSLIDDRAVLLRRNAELELQVDATMTQFSRLLTDYDEMRGKFMGLKDAVASATSLQDLGEWVQL